MLEKCCENCLYAKDMGYRQVICKKTNQWQPYLYCCVWWKSIDSTLMCNLKDK